MSKVLGQCVNFLATGVYRPMAGGVSTIDNSKQISTSKASPPAIIIPVSPSCNG
ncbi:MAG TPA: hypothetical protein VH640_23045 [Bryobacteraceae bacterium]